MTTDDTSQSPALGGEQREGPTGREPGLGGDRRIIRFGRDKILTLTEDAFCQMSAKEMSQALHETELLVVADDPDIKEAWLYKFMMGELPMPGTMRHDISLLQMILQATGQQIADVWIIPALDFVLKRLPDSWLE